MKCTILILLLMLIAFPACALTRMDAVSVGKGDAILISDGNCTVLIDTGKGYACGRIRRAMEELGIEKLDAVFITHVDSDHVEGLEWLSQHGVHVDAWYASPYFFEYKEKKHPLRKIGADVTWLEAGDEVTIGGMVFSVLAPLTKNENEENDNSLVMMLTTADGKILLTGDMEFPEEQELLMSGADLDCDVLKVSNHGDDDATGTEFLARAMPEYAVISTDSYEKPGTPDPGMLARLENVGAEYCVTEGCDAVTVILDGGSITMNPTYWPEAAEFRGISLRVDRENELFIIENSSGNDIPLENWYLYSDSGNELYVFNGGLLPAGGSITIGTNSAPDGSYDILWDEKNVISNKKDDLISLYDLHGRLIFSTY